MLKKLRIRTEIGVDKEVTFDLTQDFDLLEILSLNLHQTDVYPKDCSEFGVICGRVIINGGFGLPNAKISIFIPLDSKDSENESVKQIYPYKSQNSRNEEGYRYNLLSKDPSYTGHLSTGSFPSVDDILLVSDIKYVYEKYYKYNAKTNDAGDFMIYGAPLGEQTLVMNVDLSDIGCFSMVPEDFKLQGFPESDFNGAQFKTGSNLDALPQIVMMSKSVDIRPLWGDDESGCGAAITRADFDLREAGAIEIKPTAVFMGSMASDTEKNSVNKKCKPRRAMGELCSLVASPGTLESVRFTPFWKKEPRPLTFSNPGAIEEIPVLERYDIDGGFTIDDNGAWLVNVPMNLEYVVTNEYGEREVSPDPTVGIPTKGKYRFRAKPLETTGSARQRRRGAFLIPQIKEYFVNTPVEFFGLAVNIKGVLSSTYYFGINYFKYAEPSINMGEIIACKDVFYEFRYGRAYAVSQFHNHWKAKAKDAFIGIKEIAPREEDDCGGQAVKFPINTANKNVNFAIVMNQFITRMMQYIWITVYWLMVIICSVVDIIGVIWGFIMGVINSILCAICSAWYWFASGRVSTHCTCCCDDGCCGDDAQICCDIGFDAAFNCSSIFGCLHLRVTKYPECDKCGCYTAANGGGCISDCYGNCDDEGEEEDDYVDCTGPSSEAFHLEDGCYNIKWDNILSALVGAFGDDKGPTVAISDWRKRENLFRSMCDGLMNYFFSNNWVTGFLYAFQFKAKIKPDSDETAGFKIKMCSDVVAFHPDSQNFYYRCTPYQYDSLTNTGSFYGGVAYDAHSFNALSLLNPIGMLNIARDLLSVTPAAGANESNILAPTTIMDLGPLIENIGEICVETGGAAEGCSIANDIGVTTFADPGDFMYDAINEIVNANDGLADFISLRTPFKRYESGGWFAGDGKRRELNGGMASILSQFNEVGSVEYESPDNSSMILYGADVTYGLNSGVWTLNTSNAPLVSGQMYWTAYDLGWDYAPPGEATPYPNGGTYWQGDTFNPPNLVQYGQPAWINGWLPEGQQYWEDRSVGCPHPANGLDSIQLTVGLATATTGNQSGQEIRDCLNIYLDQTSQVVPFYKWDKGATNQVAGGYGADNRHEFGDFMTNDGDIQAGDFQDRTAWGFPTTPITSDQMESEISLGTGYHFYFGLIPGATSYDLFAKKYIPLKQDDEIYL